MDLMVDLETLKTVVIHNHMKDLVAAVLLVCHILLGPLVVVLQLLLVVKDCICHNSTLELLEVLLVGFLAVVVAVTTILAVVVAPEVEIIVVKVELAVVVMVIMVVVKLVIMEMVTVVVEVEDQVVDHLEENLEMVVLDKSG